MAGSRRGLKGATEVGNADTEKAAHRALATTAQDACYAACFNFYAPPPNNDQFFFQLVDVNGGQTCQCSKTYGEAAFQEGATVMAACAPASALRRKSRVSHRVVKAGGTKPLKVTYTLRVKGTSKRLALTGMGIQVVLPAGARVTSAVPSSGSWKAKGTHVDVAGNIVTWYPLTLAGTKTWTFKVKATLARPFTGLSDGKLIFEAQVFQNALGSAGASYCLAPADVAVVGVKYP